MKLRVMNKKGEKVMEMKSTEDNDLTVFHEKYIDLAKEDGVVDKTKNTPVKKEHLSDDTKKEY